MDQIKLMIPYDSTETFLISYEPSQLQGRIEFFACDTFPQLRFQDLSLNLSLNLVTMVPNIAM